MRKLNKETYRKRESDRQIKITMNKNKDTCRERETRKKTMTDNGRETERKKGRENDL